MLIAACSSPDRMLESLRASAPPAGYARLVVYFPGRALGPQDPINFELDGRRICDLKGDEYLVQAIMPGTRNFTFSYCGTRNLTQVTLWAQAGKTYYLRVMPYDASLTGMLSGYPRDVLEKGEKAHNGAFEVKQVDAATALEALQSYTYRPGYHP